MSPAQSEAGRVMDRKVVLPACQECGLNPSPEILGLAHIMAGELLARRSLQARPTPYTAGPAQLLPALNGWGSEQMTGLLCQATPRGEDASLTSMLSRFEALPGAIDRYITRCMRSGTALPGVRAR